ncbi:hypothetical protein Tco_1491051 [Tanacetum coccineum]
MLALSFCFVNVVPYMRSCNRHNDPLLILRIASSEAASYGVASYGAASSGAASSGELAVLRACEFLEKLQVPRSASFRRLCESAVNTTEKH